MLLNQGNKPVYQANLGLNEQNIPDPWENNNPVPQSKAIPQNWHLGTETYPLISSAGNPETPKLSSHQLTSEEILLGDELKLKTTVVSLLTQQLEKAFTLVYWLQAATANP